MRTRRAWAGLAIGVLGLWPMLGEGQQGEDRGKWVCISESLTQKLEQEGKKPAWPGLTGGIAVDRASATSIS